MEFTMEDFCKEVRKLAKNNPHWFVNGQVVDFCVDMEHMRASDLEKLTVIFNKLADSVSPLSPPGHSKTLSFVLGHDGPGHHPIPSSRQESSSFSASSLKPSEIANVSNVRKGVSKKKKRAL